MEKFNAGAALGLIDDEGATWVLMVPTMMHRIMALPLSACACQDLSRRTMVVHTAAPMARWPKEAWIGWCGRDHIWVHGATEGLVRCWIGGHEWLERPGPVDKPKHLRSLETQTIPCATMPARVRKGELASAAQPKEAP